MSQPTVQKVTVTHDTLGSLTGRHVRSNVVQFRSIPFATFPGRFRQSVLRTELDDERDFTEFGYACPARHQTADYNGGPLPDEQPRKYDEFKCLNLSVSTPLAAIGAGGDVKIDKKLPVLVYCHGGGFVEGAGSVSYRHGQLGISDVACIDELQKVQIWLRLGCRRDVLL